MEKASLSCCGGARELHSADRLGLRQIRKRKKAREVSPQAIAANGRRWRNGHPRRFSNVMCAPARR